MRIDLVCDLDYLFFSVLYPLLGHPYGFISAPHLILSLIDSFLDLRHLLHPDFVLCLGYRLRLDCCLRLIYHLLRFQILLLLSSDSFPQLSYLDLFLRQEKLLRLCLFVVCLYYFLDLKILFMKGKDVWNLGLRGRNLLLKVTNALLFLF